MIQIVLGLVVAVLYVIAVYLYNRSSYSKTYNMLAFVFIALIVETLGMFLAANIKPIFGMNKEWFEYVTYIGKTFAPTLLVMFALVYENPKVDLKKYIGIFFIPIFILISVWTNPLHNLFFADYESGTYGVLYDAYIAFTYLQLIFASLIIIRATTDKAGLLSPQTILVIFSLIIPFIPRIVMVLADNNLPSYVWPLSYMLSGILVYINVKKYNVLRAVPIALKSVINIMSDAFVVIDSNGDMLDMNNTFKSKFSSIMNLKQNKNIFDVIKYEGIKDMKKLKAYIVDAEDKGKPITEECHIVKEDYDRFFEIQIQPIRARTTNGYIATLLIFRDITEQKGNIDVIIKKENLSVIGEFAGGVAHDINTPISAIKSGLLMLKQTVKTDEEKGLIDNMTNSADKISTLVNSLKNQVRNLGSKSDTEFSLTELLQDLYVIMHSELTKNKIKLNINTSEDIWITGNTSKLAQVIDNIIDNSIAAYNGKGGIIDLDIFRDEKNDVVISIEDYAGGIPEDIKPYIFKKIVRINDMPTTGVGLYLAYSVIKGSFGGEITFDSVKGRGTKFNIIIPND